MPPRSLPSRRECPARESTLTVGAFISRYHDCDGVFVFARKSAGIIIVGGESLSRAPHRGAFSIADNINRVDGNAVELRESALNKLPVDVAMIFFQVSACGQQLAVRHIPRPSVASFGQHSPCSRLGFDA